MTIRGPFPAIVLEEWPGVARLTCLNVVARAGDAARYLVMSVSIGEAEAPSIGLQYAEGSFAAW